MDVERVVVVGGGVLGMMHALEARRRGHEVVHLEREPVPRGASVRNFGLIWVSGRAPGAELELALRARARWAQIAVQVPGTGFRAVPSLTLAADEAELGLLKEAASLPEAGLRGYELLGPDECRAVNGALRGEFTGGLLGSRDAIVEPRQVLGVLRAHLASSPARQPGVAGRAGRRSSCRPTPSATTRGPGTAATWSSCAPARRTAGSPDRTWPPGTARRCAGYGCR